MSDNSRTTPKVGMVNLENQMLSTWLAPISSIFWMVGWFWLGGFFPPLSPTAAPEQVVAFFQKSPTMLSAGMCLTMLGAALMGPYFATISQQMKRIEGPQSMMADAQLGLGMLMIVMFVFPCFDWGTAAFRPGRDAASVMGLNDTAFLAFVSGFHTTMIQWLVIGVCIMRNKDQKVFPRWLGPFNIFVALGLLPCGFTFFTKTGPFAWDGSAALWWVVVDFVAWYFVMFWQLRKSIRNQMAELQ